VDFYCSPSSKNKLKFAQKQKVNHSRLLFAVMEFELRPPTLFAFYFSDSLPSFAWG
jgi:hypothetical protein